MMQQALSLEDYFVVLIRFNIFNLELMRGIKTSNLWVGTEKKLFKNERLEKYLIHLRQRSLVWTSMFSESYICTK